MGRRAKLWKWSTGGYGATVRVEERTPGGNLYAMAPKPGGGWRKVSLGHRDKELAMREAAALSARRQGGDDPLGTITAAAVFDLYLKAVTPKQSERHGQEVKRFAEVWVRFLGPTFDLSKFGPGDWERFTRAFAAGDLDGHGCPVEKQENRRVRGPRSVAIALKVLRAACRRATIERTRSGGFVLAADPTRGLPLPVEKNPKRPVLDDERVDLLVSVATKVQMRIGFGRQARWELSYLPALIRIAADAGRRIRSILYLRWSDWLPEMGTNGAIRWRAENDKRGYEATIPVSPEVRLELEELRQRHPGVGEGFLFPAPNAPGRPLSVQVAAQWLHRAEGLAGLTRIARGGWHALRRRWATARKDMPVKDVMQAGGWRDPGTLLRCYQVADVETLERVVLRPKQVRRVLA
jgi:integrase